MATTKLRWPLSLEWTAQDRLRIVAAFLPEMQDDIYAGRYSDVGRPNITALQHILGDPAEDLEHARADCEKAVAKYEAHLPEDYRWSK